MGRSNMDALLDDGVKSALHFLEKNGEFLPFAVVMSRRGEMRHAQTLQDETQSEPIIESLIRALKRRAVEDDLVSVAIVSDVRLTDQVTAETSPAIRIDIDDEEVSPVTCYVPYEIHAGGVKSGEIVATAGTGGVFAK